MPQALAVNPCCIKKPKLLHFATRRVLFHSMNADYMVTAKSTNIAFKWSTSTTRLYLFTKYGLIWCYKNSSFPKTSFPGKVAFYLVFCDAVYTDMPINMVCAGVMYVQLFSLLSQDAMKNATPLCNNYCSQGGSMGLLEVHSVRILSFLLCIMNM